MTGEPRRVRVVEAFPEIVEHLDPEQREQARRQLVADLVVAKAGRWTPQVPTDAPGHLGLLVLDGLLSRDVILEKPLATELVGQGDLLRPSDRDGADAPVPFEVSWTVLEPARFAVLDPVFAHSLAITLAVSNLRRVDVRLLMLLWYLADRWGRVTPDGVIVPLRLTHETLARLVGAQRPSVTTAIRQLEQEDHLRRTQDRLWLLCGAPPERMTRHEAAASVGD
jgi:CRP/FNR family transcriptional regulator, cyclic AMP receptor protein